MNEYVAQKHTYLQTHTSYMVAQFIRLKSWSTLYLSATSQGQTNLTTLANSTGMIGI